MTRMKDDQNRPVVMIEYHRIGNLWMPHEAFVSHAPTHPNYCAHHDFAWSRGAGALFYHEAGMGPGVYVNGWSDGKIHAKLWFNESAGVEMRQGSGKPVENLRDLGFEQIKEPLPLGKIQEPNPFVYGTEGRVIYCKKCRDFWSEDDHCEHIFWCDQCNEWGGSASDKERCKHRRNHEIF